MSQKALVVGGGIQGIQAALDLADCGVEVTLVEETSTLQVNSPGGILPEKRAEVLLSMPKLLKAASHHNINIITNASVAQVKGKRGDFRATIIKRPRYVDTDICTSCGRCERECPVDIMPWNTETQNGHKAIHRPDFGLKSVPSTYTVEKEGIPPCTAACPAGVNAHGYVALIAKGKFTEALVLITEAVPLPRVLGRVCHHPCESKCTRGKIDQAVSICALKRFVADTGSTESSLRRAQTSSRAVKPTGPPRVAIIGAGPAGLTAACDLARLGHQSMVFEALPVAGGMMSVGMPRFRLPDEARQADINDIMSLGIEIRTSTPIGSELTLQDLRHQGYEAILIATGAHKNQSLGIPGENLSGVINSVAFLRAINLGQPITVGSKVVVVGGGYTAIDSARTAVRLRCERVLILYRRSLEEMPANPEEVAEAREEGVEIEYLAAPVRIVGQEGKVTGIECVRMRLGEPDKSGRRRPIPAEGSEFFIEADTVIVAVGQRTDLSFLNGDTTLTDGKEHIVVDPQTMATRVPGIFAAGDAAGEPGKMIDAIAGGRQAAISIDGFLQGEELSQETPLDKAMPVEVNLDEIFIPPIEHQPMPQRRKEDRVGNFSEVNLGFATEMAVREAERCLNCAGCSECLECERACELNAVDHKLTTKELELKVEAIITTGQLFAQSKDEDEANLTALASRPGVYLIAPPSRKGDLSPASAVAARVMVDLAKHRQVSKDGHKTRRETSKTVISETAGSYQSRQTPGRLEPRLGIFVCGCGGNISEVVDVPDVVEYCQGLSDIAYSGEIGYACTSEAAEEINNIIRQHRLTHVVLAACSCCNLDQICYSCSDRRIRCKSNLLDGARSDDVGYEFVNIREHCAWVHHKTEEATAKAKALIRAGIARARDSQLPAKETLNIERSVLVLGGGPGGMQAAANLAAQGFATILVSHDEKINSTSELRQRLESELVRNGATMLYGTKLTTVAGKAGRYQVTVAQNGKWQMFTVGTIILDISAGLEASIDGTELPLPLRKALPNRPVVAQPISEPAVSRVPGIFLCGTGQTVTDVTEALIQGVAAASKASILLNRGTLDVEPTVVTVDQMRCRGCGTCASICLFGAAMLSERKPEIMTAQIDEGLCRGCGICVAHCPSGALSQSRGSDSQITASLEAILA